MSRQAVSFVRRALVADAAISGSFGVLLLLAAGLLEGLLGVPATLLRYAGLVLIPFAGLLVYLAKRDTPSPASIWMVIALNTAWIIASGALLLSGLVGPSALGYAFIIAQAVAVAVFVELQYVGVRRLTAAVA